MKRYLLRLILIVGSCAPLLVPAQGANKDFTLGKIGHEEVQTPQYQVRVTGSSKSDGRLDWLVLTAEYETEPDWTDEITFTYEVMLEGEKKNLPKDAKTPYTMYRGSVSYVNVPEGRRESNMFLDPSTFERFGEVKSMRVTATVNGEPAGELVEPKAHAKLNWWKEHSASAIPLLNRTETPWRFVEVEAHGTIKP